MKLDLLLLIDNNILALAVSMVALSVIWRRFLVVDHSHFLFVLVFLLNIGNLILDTLTTLLEYAVPSVSTPLKAGIFALFFLCSLSLCYCWLLFVDTWATRAGEPYAHRSQGWTALFVASGLLIATSPWTGLVFKLTPAYQRGPLYLVYVLLDYFFLFGASAIVWKRRKLIDVSEFTPLILFSIVPLAGTVVQTLRPNIYVIWPSVAYALLIIFIHLQQRLVQTDRLTGAWGRDRMIRHLDAIIPKRDRFALVFLDLDHFKLINDQYGHEEGDRVLIRVVSLIQKGLRQGDYVARYGGDEFVIFLNAREESEVQTVLKRIEGLFGEYNRSSGLPYSILFSLGWEFYSGQRPSTAAELVCRVDGRMYADKRRRRGTPPSTNLPID